MKKIYSFALAAVAILSAASCQKELVNETLSTAEGDAFTVTAIAPATKTVLDDVNTYWTPGDQIAVYDATGAEVTFSTDITEKSATAVFSTEAEFALPESLLAVYPKRTDRGETSYSGGVVKGLHIGGSQTAVAGSFDPTYAVAVGTPKAAGSTELIFNNVHTLVKFIVGGTEAPKTVTLKNNGMRMIAGMFDYNTADGTATVTQGAGEITLNGPFEVGKAYYIALTPGICGDGITLLYDGVEQKNTGETITLEANKIYNLGVLPEPEFSTIKEVIAAGASESAVTTKGIVVATYTRGALIKDETDYILIYNGSALDVEVGDKVMVQGKTSEYGGMLQFGQGSTVTILSTGHEVVHPEPAVLDGAGMDDLLTSKSISYIEYTGTLAKSGNYYNVNVDGAATAVGSLQYIDDEVHNASALDGKVITVRGYFIGVSSSRYVNTMTVSVKEKLTSEKVIWEGTHDTAEWQGNQDLAWGGYDWTTAEVGQRLKLYVTPKDAKADWWCISLRVAGDNWANLNGVPTQYDKPSYSITVDLTQEIIDDLVARNGLVFTGNATTVTKITILPADAENVIWAGEAESNGYSNCELGTQKDLANNGAAAGDKFRIYVTAGDTWALQMFDGQWKKWYGTATDGAQEGLYGHGWSNYNTDLSNGYIEFELTEEMLTTYAGYTWGTLAILQGDGVKITKIALK